MVVFFTDIDNTLIYSHRRELPNDKVAVEWIDEKAQSYMTKKSFSFFSSLSGVEIVPVTTRTVEQYMRLHSVMTEFGCRYALVCNGAVLLENGIVDHEWVQKSRAIANEEFQELIRAKSLLEHYCSRDTIKNGSGFLYYANVDNPIQVSEWVSSYVDTSQVQVFNDSHKVYCMPISLSKGLAVKRMQNKIESDCIISAGDSKQDISMLEGADFAIAHESIAEHVKNKHIFVNNEKIFSDGICSIINLLKREINYETL